MIVGVVGGLVGGLIFGYLVFASPSGSTPKIQGIAGTVVAVSADRDAVGIRMEDGTDEGFAVGRAIQGIDLLRRGARVRLDVAYLNGDTLVIRVRPG